MHQYLLVHLGLLQRQCPFLVHVLHQFDDESRQFVRLLRLDHVTKAFVNHELLVRLQISQVVRQHVDQIVHVWLDIGRVIPLSEHVLGQACDL